MAKDVERRSQLSADLFSVKSLKGPTYQNPFLNSQLPYGRAGTLRGSVFKMRNGSRNMVANILQSKLILRSAGSDTINWRSQTKGLTLSTSPIQLSTITSPKLSINFQLNSDRAAFQIYNIVEELIDSERNYLNSLFLLENNYIEPLLEAYQKNLGVPIVLIDGYIQILIQIHFEFYNRLQSEYLVMAHFEFNEQSEEHDSLISFADNIAQLIAKYAISPYIYEQYCFLNRQIVDLMTTSDAKADLFQNYSKAKNACELFTESSQDQNQKMDLSFISLFQKPIARIAKYKLILENLSKSIETPANELAVSGVNHGLQIVKEKLTEINMNVRKHDQDLSRFKTIFESLDCYPPNIQILKSFFRDDRLSDNFGFECFGNPILCGCLGLIVMSSNCVPNFNFTGCLLFKSHIIVFDCKSQEHQFEIKFMIPLCCCKLIDENDFEGLVCPNEPSFKLIFEDNFLLYELLFITSNQFERDIWTEKFNLLINEVNGPYIFDYSMSEERLLIYYFGKLTPYDVCLEKFGAKKLGSFKTNFNNCYFKELFILNIDWTNDVAFVQEVSQNQFILSTKRRDKIGLHNQMAIYWSDELKVKPEAKTKEELTHIKINRERSLFRRASLVLKHIL